MRLVLEMRIYDKVGYGIQDTRYGIQDTGCKIQDARSKMQDTRSGKQDSGKSEVKQPGFLS
jgi:hypothetical protein